MSIEKQNQRPEQSTISACQSTINNHQSTTINQQSPGSIFHFIAWFKKAEDKEIRRFIPVSLSNKKALIIDDNQTNLDILTHLLESVGMRVVALRNGADVVPTLTNALESGDPFDACILDIQMPGMSGYEVVKQIRNPKSTIQGLQPTIIQCGYKPSNPFFYLISYLAQSCLRHDTGQRRLPSGCGRYSLCRQREFSFY